MKKGLFIIPLLLLPIITSCGSNEVSLKDIPDIKTYIENLKQVDNYTLSVNIDDKSSTNYDVIYNKNYYFNTNSSLQYGYASSKKDEVFYFENYDGTLVASTSLKNDKDELITNLWDSKLFTSFKSLSSKAFKDATQTTFALEDKLTIIKVMNMVNLDESLYISFKEMNMEINDSNELIFDFDFTSVTGSITVHNINKSKSSDVESLRKTGPYVYDDIQSLMYQGFNNDNFSEVLYDEDGQFAGYNTYTDQYFFQDLSTAYIEKYALSHGGNTPIQQGYMKVVNGQIDTDEEKETGVFRIDWVDGYCIFSDYGITNTDIALQLTYPKYAEFLSNMQYFSYDKNLKCYTTMKTDLVEDFYTKFQIDKMVGEYNAFPFRICYEATASDNKLDTLNVLLTFQVTIGGQLIDIPIEFTNFGTTTSNKMEQVIAEIYK